MKKSRNNLKTLKIQFFIFEELKAFNFRIHQQKDPTKNGILSDFWAFWQLLAQVQSVKEISVQKFMDSLPGEDQRLSVTSFAIESSRR